MKFLIYFKIIPKIGSNHKHVIVARNCFKALESAVIFVRLFHATGSTTKLIKNEMQAVFLSLLFNEVVLPNFQDKSYCLTLLQE